MNSSPTPAQSGIAQQHSAPQHGPRPLPLFLSILWRETENDPELRRLAFQGLRKYQRASRPPPPPEPEIFARAGDAKLLRFGAGDDRAPVVFIPSLINPPQVLDLSEKRSLLRCMAAAGHDAYLIDWGRPAMKDSLLGLDGHVMERLLPMIAALPRPPILVGYCLGGPLALAAATLSDARAVATIAAPWRFDGFPDSDLELIASLWRNAEPISQRLGYVPMEVLQSGFWAIDPQRTIRKYAAFSSTEPGSDAERAFLAVEDWANGGPPLTYQAGRDLFENFYAANASGNHQWRVGGKVVNPAELICPTLSICSATDRIVPAGAAPDLAERITLNLGHVGMIVSSSAPDQLWKPLSLWLSTHGG